MSRSGHLALQRIVLEYSTKAGNDGVRQALSRELPQFQKKFPTVEIELRRRRAPLEMLTGFYRDGSEHSYNIEGFSAQGIWIRMHRLAQSCNDYHVPFDERHLHYSRRSVQGAWNPWLWGAERLHDKHGIPAWDRRLTEKEWKYYTDKYSKELENQEKAIKNKVDAANEWPRQITNEVAQRWREHVTPKLQTDMEHNIQRWKEAAKGDKMEDLPGPIKMGEYRLFSAPEHGQIGQDALTALRRKEQGTFEAWWSRRKEQLKPPA